MSSFSPDKQKACDVSRSAGFTLVEVVISLAILSLIMVATISALRTFGQTQSTLSSMTNRVDEVRSVSSFLRDTFESAVIGRASTGLSMGGGTNEGSYFLGNSVAMSWKAFVQFGEGWGGALLLRLEQDEKALKLRWQEIPGTRGDVDWSQTAERVLIDEIQELNISYRAEFDTDWQNEWFGDELPALVRMTVKARGRFWPELILKVQR
ncbi:MAG: type II secretion system protein J [Halioglobus sp.]